MPIAYSHFLTVPPSAIDLHGHVNNVAFVQWMQDAAVAHSDAVGLTAATAALKALWVVRSHEIQYRKQVFLGDALEVKTWVADCRMVSSRRRYEFYRVTDDPPALLARGETDWVLIDAATFHPLKIPAQLQKLFDPPAGFVEEES